MKYTILTQWETMDGTYHSATVDKNNYSVAVGDFHSKFKPLQNDSNVRWFRLSLVSESGVVSETAYWIREEVAESELSE